MKSYPDGVNEQVCGFHVKIYNRLVDHENWQEFAIRNAHFLFDFLFKSSLTMSGTNIFPTTFAVYNMQKQIALWFCSFIKVVKDLTTQIFTYSLFCT